MKTKINNGIKQYEFAILLTRFIFILVSKKKFCCLVIVCNSKILLNFATLNMETYRQFCILLLKIKPPTTTKTELVKFFSWIAELCCPWLTDMYLTCRRFSISIQLIFQKVSFRANYLHWLSDKIVNKRDLLKIISLYWGLLK